MKVLKVSTTTLFGDESEMDFTVSESVPEAMYVVAVLEGILKAKSVIRHFEVVEV